MSWDHYYYLFLDLASLSYPLYKHGDPRIRMRGHRKALGLSIAVMALVFLVWDIWKTRSGVWGFNPRYNLGWEFLWLPLEEWLFFLCIPFACIFIHEVMRHYVPRGLASPAGSRRFSRVLAAGLILAGIFFLDKTYTSVTCLAAGIYLLLLTLWMKPDWLGQFYLGYLVSLLPFLLVNGALTGLFTPEPVVWYNDAENLGIRILTIPLEDTVYLLLMLLLPVSLYETAIQKKDRHRDF